uniref:MFS domain-containing protein n=1 Tax=Haemonchus contortus TaxID=6289 RepID=A0A7I5E809_HAECO
MSQAQRFPLFHPYSRRLHLLVLCMIGLFNSTYMNVNLAITMTCMVNSTAISMEGRDTEETLGQLWNISSINYPAVDACSANKEGRKVLDYGGSLVWNHRVQNLLFSAAFWGSIATILPSIFLVQRMNKKLVFMLCVLNKVTVNALLPYLAIHHGANAVFVARFILGAGESFIYPCINTIVANWFPIDERSTAVALFTTGNQVALFIGNPLAAGLCDSSYGWPAVYYISAAMGAVWCVLWMLFSSNSPDECRVMKMEERKFLKRSAVLVKGDGQGRSPPIPWRKIITNRPFIAHLISTWILTNVVTVMMVYLPTYYKDVLLLGVIMNGLYSSLPMMFNFVFKLSWGVLVDRLKRRNILTPTLGVKISQCFPTFGVAAGLIPVALLATCQRPVLALVLLCFTNMCFGAHTSGAYTSLLSLAPRFTPTLSSISVSVSMLAQLTTPFMVAAVVSIGTMEEWNNLFLLSSLLCIVSGTVFSVFGSGDVQEFAKCSKNIDSLESNNNLLSPLPAGTLRADSISML